MFSFSEKNPTNMHSTIHAISSYKHHTTVNFLVLVILTYIFPRFYYRNSRDFGGTTFYEWADQMKTSSGFGVYLFLITF